MKCEQVRDEIPLYVLGALDAETAGRVREHVRTCDACREELASYSEIPYALNLAVPDEPLPRGFTTRLLERVEPASRVAAPVPIARRRSWWLPWAVAAACLALAVALGVNTWRVNAELAQIHDELYAQRDYDAQMSALMSRPDIVPVVLQSSRARVRGKVYLAPDRSAAVLMVSNLPRLRKGQVYELWLNAPAHRVAVTTFVPLENGSMRFYLSPPDGLKPYKSIGITVEPAGGSPAPTSPRVVGGEL